MKKFLVMMMAFALMIEAQVQQEDGGEYQPSGMDALLAAMIVAKIHQDSIDTSSLVAVYDYECQTQDADSTKSIATEEERSSIRMTYLRDIQRQKARSAVRGSGMLYGDVIRGSRIAKEIPPK